MSDVRKPGRLSAVAATLAPGLLVAATGVGAGDLLTASLAGSDIGLTVLWAAVVGVVLKWFLNEGLARWQLATGTTLLEGWVRHLGRWLNWVFLLYVLFFTIMVGGALVNACGVAGAALVNASGIAGAAHLPLFDDPRSSKIVWGVVHSFAGLALVWIGGFRLFERMMAVCIGLMFLSVVSTAIALGAPAGELLRGIAVPTIPRGGLGRVLGVLGGVGGTLTLMSYGYWIRETDRAGREGLRTCRIDLAAGYAMTALFGICMIIIGSRLHLHDGGTIAHDIGVQVRDSLGRFGHVARWVFLVGFWGAVFSSLLGVWQSVPYLFADFVRIAQRRPAPPDLTRTTAYRAYLIAIAILPLPLLWGQVRQIQFAYAITGACFMPLLALTLLLLNGRERWVGRAWRNGPVTTIVLIATLAFFSFFGYWEVRERLTKPPASTAPPTTQPASP